MSSRTVTDVDGRAWACEPDSEDHRGSQLGQDVRIRCTTESLDAPVRITVGWRWMQMADDALARLIAKESPVPGKALQPHSAP